MNNEDWIKKQCLKYAGNNFGETNEVVDRGAKAFDYLCKYAKPTMSHEEFISFCGIIYCYAKQL